MVKVTNISGGLLVCTLKDGSTLRLKNKKSTTISKDLLTKYLRDIEKKGLVKIRDVVIPSTITTKSAEKQPKKEKEKEKEVVQNGNV